MMNLASSLLLSTPEIFLGFVSCIPLNIYPYPHLSPSLETPRWFWKHPKYLGPRLRLSPHFSLPLNSLTDLVFLPFPPPLKSMSFPSSTEALHPLYSIRGQFFNAPLFLSAMPTSSALIFITLPQSPSYKQVKYIPRTSIPQSPIPCFPPY